MSFRGKSSWRSKSSPATGPHGMLGTFRILANCPGILRSVHSSVEQTPSDGTDVLEAQREPNGASNGDILESFGAIFTGTNRSRLLRIYVTVCVYVLVLFVCVISRAFVSSSIRTSQPNGSENRGPKKKDLKGREICGQLLDDCQRTEILISHLMAVGRQQRPMVSPQPYGQYKSIKELWRILAKCQPSSRCGIGTSFTYLTSRETRCFMATVLLHAGIFTLPSALHFSQFRVKFTLRIALHPNRHPSTWSRVLSRTIKFKPY